MAAKASFKPSFCLLSPAFQGIVPGRVVVVGRLKLRVLQAPVSAWGRQERTDHALGLLPQPQGWLTNNSLLIVFFLQLTAAFHSCRIPRWILALSQRIVLARNPSQFFGKWLRYVSAPHLGGTFDVESRRYVGIQ